jgi:hypothetical protein
MVLFTGVGTGVILIYFDVDQEQLKKMSLLQILDGWNTKHVSVYISKSEINGAPDDQFDEYEMGQSFSKLGRIHVFQFVPIK